MKKMLLLAVAAMALALAPANAAPGNGCTAGPGGLDTASTCTYTADVGTARAVVATPNNWTITTVCNATTAPVRECNVGETIVLAEGETAPPTSPLIDTVKGDVVMVTMGPDCIPPFDTPCGSAGTISVYETL